MSRSFSGLHTSNMCVCVYARGTYVAVIIRRRCGMRIVDRDYHRLDILRVAQKRWKSVAGAYSLTKSSRLSLGGNFNRATITERLLVTDPVPLACKCKREHFNFIPKSFHLIWTLGIPFEYFVPGLITVNKTMNVRPYSRKSKIARAIFATFAVTKARSRNRKKYFRVSRIIWENLCPLGAGVIMYSITILIETNWSRSHESGQAVPLNLCDKRSPFIEIIYYSTAPRRWAA